jgi:mannose-6-phosphate isomerase-like protein (cupin superfamily)
VESLQTALGGQMKPTIHPKSWGFESWVENCPEYCGKVLVFRAGGKTSMHYHIKKLETMYLRSGKVIIRMEDETVPLEPGDKLQIQRFQLHQIEAIEDSELYEFSTFHEESDSIRIPA